MNSDILKLHFTKMHGIGNDYIYINGFQPLPSNLPLLSILLSNRHTGIGGDGIILILPSENADFMMRIFNADGSEAKMCGNGIRCVGKYIYDHRLTDKRTVTIDTLSGIKRLQLTTDESNLVESVTVNMGNPGFSSQEVGFNADYATLINRRIDLDTLLYNNIELTAVSMGNPHGVIFVAESPDNDMVWLDGPILENLPLWHDRANIEFIHVIDRSNLEMRVWERGSGETMACGTGACAAAVAAIATGRADRKVSVHLLGGTLHIEWPDNNSPVFMTGPASTVFEGDIKLKTDPLTQNLEIV